MSADAESTAISRLFSSANRAGLVPYLCVDIEDATCEDSERAPGSSCLSLPLLHVGRGRGGGDPA
jgi:hypothetical protein